MSDLPPQPDDRNDSGQTREGGSAGGTPGWVKIFGAGLLAMILLVAGLALFGGGRGGHSPSRHTSSSPEHDQTGGIGEPADADQTTRTVEVTALDTMTFEPSQITVSAGETVTLVVTNAGQSVHEFTLGDAEMQQEHAKNMAGRMAHDEPNSITLQPGETRQLTWQFGDAGLLEFACHEPGHFQAGMRGQITVS